jgi:hypothetical protein
LHNLSPPFFGGSKERIKQTQSAKKVSTTKGGVVMTKDDECKLHSGLRTQIDNLKESDVRQWEVITKLQNRLPVWATVVISLLTFLLGCALTYAKLATG